jgi:NADH dehydrogenase (ubiquinone) 1 beta subcomplex subunit 8
MIGTFIATFLSVSGVVYMFYPDMPAYPREFPGGLEKELGGPGALRVSYLLIVVQHSCLLTR